MQRQEVVDVLQKLLEPDSIADSMPNGLQVEGRSEIQRIITGVTASQALIEVGIAERADALLVHHGYFWSSDPKVICGMQRQRLKRLLTHDINLLAYHLPLDIHPSLGNNAQLANLLGIDIIGPIAGVSPEGVALYGELPVAMGGSALADQIERQLGRKPLHCDDGAPHLIKRVAWCTGAGQRFLLPAAEHGVDAFITGEVSEQTIHIAREMGLHFYAIGHHASERYGIHALGAWLAQQHGLLVRFIDIANPA